MPQDEIDIDALIGPLLASALDAVVAVDDQGRVIAWNQTAEQTFLWRREEALGQLMTALIVPERYRAAYQRDLQRYRQTGKAQAINRRIEIAAIDKQGREFPIEVAISAVQAQSQTYFIGFLRDISDRRAGQMRAQALLRLSDRLRDLDDIAQMSFAAAEILGETLKGSGAGYGTIDPGTARMTIERDWFTDGAPSLAGKLDLHDLGAVEDDLRFGDLVVYADARHDPRTAAVAPHLEAIGARAALMMPVMENATLVAVLYVNDSNPREWTESAVSFSRAVADRTRSAIERRRAEAALRALNATLESQIEQRTAERDRVWRNSRDLLAVIGTDGLFRAANPAWTSVLGYTMPDIAGRTFLEFIWPEDVALTLQALRDALASGGDANFEHRLRHRDGTPRWIAWRTSCEGDVIYAYGRHVTLEREQAETLRRTEDALRQSQKMEAVGQLTGGVAHDFNNLLQGITGSLELLQTRLTQKRFDGLERYTLAAQSAAKRAAALTQRLLAFSRRQRLDPKSTDLSHLVVEMEELIRRTMGPEIVVDIAVDPNLWTARIDQSELDNALLNLCINARDAMSSGGRLSIRTENRVLEDHAAQEHDLPPGDYVTLSVRDTGTGMTRDIMRRAFDPFFTTKPLGTGTGLGLSMIYGFIRQSGGQIRVDSTIGRGTSMTLFLPRFRTDPAEDEAAGPVTAAPPPMAPPGSTVLVVDDEPTVRMFVADTLAANGHAVIQAADGHAGLNMLQSALHTDLLVTDIGLPSGMNGRQLAEAARRLRPDLKILFITGYDSNAALSSSMLDDGMAVLTKPFALNDLLRKIGDLYAR